jgi:hypothetical protein
MNTTALFGDKETFAIECEMFKEEHETQIAVFIKGKNILEFERNGINLTTRWDLDDIVKWLRDFVDNIKDDPYPVECKGTYAAIKDIEARDFDSDDEEIFDAYYDKLDDWNHSHRWHSASNGAILADVYFQKVGNQIEISWNNEDDEVNFKEKLGGALILKDNFISVVNSFLKFYAEYWF